MTTENIHVTRWGSGTPVLFVHGGSQGGPENAEDQWAKQRPLAEEGYELILPDRPGHGRSPSRGPEDFKLDAVWVDELLGSGAHLVGHSYGGAIALAAAGRRPEAVTSLTLIEAPIFSVAAEDPGVKAFRARVHKASTTKNPVLALVRLMRAVNVPVRQIDPKPGLKHLVPMGRHFQSMRPPYEWDASEAIAAVRSAQIPLLAVTGGWNPGFEAIADALVDEIGGKRIVLDVGHHLPQIEGAPLDNEFNAALLEFLSAHRDRTPAPAS